MTNVSLIVGTTMGTALKVSKTIKSVLDKNGYDVKLIDSYKKNGLDLISESLLIICTSNTGMGDIPKNLKPFYEDITDPLHQGLKDKCYSIVNLGDSSFVRFAQAGYTLDTALQKTGAKRLGDIHVMDAAIVDDYESDAHKWAISWMNLL